MGESGEAVVSIENRALERYTFVEPFLQGTRTLASIAAQADVNLRTAQRWVDLYRRNGLEALAQKQRVDRGTKRAMSQRMVETIEGLALERPRVPISAIYRELKEFASKTGERLPSYPAAYRLVKAIPISLMTLAHSGTPMSSTPFTGQILTPNNSQSNSSRVSLANGGKRLIESWPSPVRASQSVIDIDLV